jgi:hypothetical protein
MFVHCEKCGTVLEKDYAYKQVEPVIKYKKTIEEGEQETYIDYIYFCNKHKPWFKQWIRHKPYYMSNYMRYTYPK